MKSAFSVLAALGIVLLVVAAFGRFVGDPGRVMGLKTLSIVIMANTMFLLAIVSKMYDSK